MTIKQSKELTKVRRRSLYEELPVPVVRFLDDFINWTEVGNPIVLWEIPSLKPKKKREEERTEEKGALNCIIAPERLNDIRYVNKFLEAMNERLQMGGFLVGCVETTSQRRARQMTKFIWPINVLYCVIDYFVFRVWPKLPYLKKIYFALSKGRNRVLSEMETYGRLYSCGFRLVDSIFTEDRMFFLAEKVKQPDYNLDPTYGPLIRLRRIGKNGKPIRVYKFRTMYPYSEYLQEFVYQRQGLQEGGKIKADPRVNSVGAFMRRYWLDEFPMLINLVKGDLKLFGVRPISKQYMSLYPENYRAYRNQFKPGLIPPFYADLPRTLEEIIASEERYLKAFEKQPILTDLRYLWKSANNIFFRQARSN